MAYRLGRASKAHLVGVDSRLIEILEAAIKITVVDFGVPATGGLRTTETQQELCAAGVSMCDGVIKKSKHQSGLAVDIFAYDDGKASWEDEDLALAATAILQSAVLLGYKIQWGGLWKNFKDAPHFEIVGT
jgi:peptidoglycan LD-endopeptidase CwlK